MINALGTTTGTARGRRIPAIVFAGTGCVTKRPAFKGEQNTSTMHNKNNKTQTGHNF